METKQAIVLPSGWEAQVEVNPHYYYDDSILWNEFNRKYPPRPLTQYHTPGAKVEVREVWQTRNGLNCEWFKSDGDKSQQFKEHPNHYRQAFEVVSEEESKPDWEDDITIRKKSGEFEDDCITLKSKNNLSVEEAAESYGVNQWGKRERLMTNLEYVDRSKNDFIAGANHIIQSGEYVSKAEVIKIMQQEINIHQQIDSVDGQYTLDVLYNIQSRITKLKDDKK